MYTLLILFFALAIAVSFLCSLWEAVLLSITPTYAQIEREQGSAIGATLADFKDNVDRPLAAILTLNTVAHTMGAIGVGAQAALLWADDYPMITQVVVPVVMTLAVLVVSEIIPKTLGATFWKQLAPFTVRGLRLIVALLAPFVWVSQRLTGLLKPDHRESVLSRSDFVAMARLGAQEGVFAPRESEIIHNLLRFESVRAEHVMTPRTVVFAVPETLTLRAFYDEHHPSRFSRVPVYEGRSKDNATGYVLMDELLAALVDGRDEDTVGSIKRKLLVVPESQPLPDLFARFLAEREHIALVVDEFGGMAGVVSMEDVIETLLGLEIVDESDDAEDLQALARSNWSRRARARGIDVASQPADG